MRIAMEMKKMVIITWAIQATIPYNSNLKAVPFVTSPSKRISSNREPETLQT